MKKKELQKLKTEQEANKFEPIFHRRSPRVPLDIEERIERAKKELVKFQKGSDYFLSFVDEKLEHIIFSKELKSRLRDIIFSDEEGNTQFWEGRFIQGEDFSYDWGVNDAPDKFLFLEATEEIASSDKIQVIEDERDGSSGQGSTDKSEGEKQFAKGSRDVEVLIEEKKEKGSNYSQDSHRKLDKGGSNKISFIILVSVSLVGLVGVVVAKIAR